MKTMRSRKHIFKGNPYDLIGGLFDLINYIKIQSEKKLEDMILIKLGSYQGESTNIFASSGFQKVIAVDYWKVGEDRDNIVDVEKKFDERMSKYSNVIKVKSLTSDYAKTIPNNFADVVYIDADHSYNGIKTDIETYYAKIKDGGFLCGHDYNAKWWGCKGVTKAVDELNMNIKTFKDTSWLTRKG